MPNSLIDRLPATWRSRFLQGLSRNFRGPGAPMTPRPYGGVAPGRGSPTWGGSGSGARGIIPIEVIPASLQAQIAVNLPPGVASVTLDHGSGATPPTGTYTDRTFQTVAYTTGQKTVTVTAPANYKGEVVFSV